MYPTAPAASAAVNKTATIAILEQYPRILPRLCLPRAGECPSFGVDWFLVLADRITSVAESNNRRTAPCLSTDQNEKPPRGRPGGRRLETVRPEITARHSLAARLV